MRVRRALCALALVAASCAQARDEPRVHDAPPVVDRSAADSAFADSVIRASEDMGADVTEVVSSRGAPARDTVATRLALQAYGTGTYLDEILAARDSMVFRWPEREPLRVWVQRATLLPDQRGFVRAVEEAFPPWTETGIPVEFSFTEDSARADVLVTWVPRYESRTTARTRWVHDQNGWITGGAIEIARAQPNGRPLELVALQAVARHEVGHLLGLDHCADEANIMAATVRVTELSEADRATVRLVYKLPPGRLRAP